MRALAVLFVIHQHWGPYEIKSLPAATFFLQKILPSGLFGVDFFFVLSGFLISSILLKLKDGLTEGSKFKVIGQFMARRSLRIFPLYFVLLAILFIFNYPDIRRYIVYFSTYTTNFLEFNQLQWNAFGHAWTLAVEEQFYLIWPFITIFSPKKWMLSIILFFIAFGTVSDFIIESKYGHIGSVLPFNCFNIFAIGALYSFSLVNPGTGILIKKILLYLMPLAIVLYVLCDFGYKFFPDHFANAIISVNLIIYVAEKKYGNAVSAVINNKFLTGIGKISYGIYLFHYIIPTCFHKPFVFITTNLRLSQRMFMIVTQPYMVQLMQLSILILISYLSYHYFEAKVLKLKRYFDYTKTDRI